MIKLILKIILLFFLIILSYISIILIIQKTDLAEMKSDYLAAAIDKHAILERARSPKIIFIGGSSVAFGLDSNMIEKHLKYSVVNMGLHAGLGVKYILSEVKNEINSGDIIVISLEYHHFFDKRFINGTVELSEVILYYPKALYYLDYIQFKYLLKEIPLLFQIKLRAIINYIYIKVVLKEKPYALKIYNRETFNLYGDAENHLDQPSPEEYIDSSSSITLPKTYDKEVILILNKFHRYARRKNAQVYFAFPSIPEDLFNENIANMDNFNRWLKSRLSIPLFGEPLLFTLQRKCFYDTFYHLNRKGREIRSRKLTEELEKAINYPDALISPPKN